MREFMSIRLLILALLAASGSFASLLIAAETDMQIQRDICYAEVADQRLLLDLYLPLTKQAVKQELPLIVWVHGGAWRAGSKADMPLGKLVTDGYAIASIDYRLSPVAKFPAQVHDLKAAIRYLRAEQQSLKIEASQIAIAGSSAGGHLAALVGVTNGHRELEGSVGNHADQSSDVQAIVSFFGMSNFTTILAQSTPHGLKVRVPALELLLGGQPTEQPELARLASPVYHVDVHDPPLLLFHGDQDPQAPINQSHELHAAYKKAGLSVRFDVLPNAAHGGSVFYTDEQLQVVRDFLNEECRDKAK